MTGILHPMVVQPPRPQQEGDDTDGHVDQEHPSPADRVDEDTAGEGPDGGRHGGGNGEDGGGLGALAFAERTEQDGHPNRYQQSAAQ